MNTRILASRCSGYLALIAVAAIAAGCASTDEVRVASDPGSPCRFSPATSVHCGRTPTTAIDAAGRLWTTYVIGEHVYVASSRNLGRSWSRAVQVNRDPEPVYTNGENRPKIAFGQANEIFVSWTRVTEGRFAGDIRFARSTDGGRHFEAVHTINDDGLQTSHRFETLFVDSSGHIYLAWLDKRDQVRALEQGDEYNGAAVYYTVSTDGGASFAANQKVADFSCECCRIAMAETLGGDVAVFWRHIFDDNVRDHAFAVLGIDRVVMPLRRPVDDNWRIEACPHHGPAMAVADDGSYHLVWFSLGDRKGISYARYNPTQSSVSRIRSVATTGSSHADIARRGTGLDIVWKQFDGNRTHIMLTQSPDEGNRWTPPVSLAATTGASDHPLLIQQAGRTWLSWHTELEGLQIMEISDGGSPR